MTDFTASNGITVKYDDDNFRIDGLEPCAKDHLMSQAETIALREFFRAERDEELGLWRWPENPDYVVRPVASGGALTVTRESTGNNGTFGRDLVSGFGGYLYAPRSDYSKAARAYFEAHPERKPWEDAKEGEMWALTMKDGVPLAAIFRGGVFVDGLGAFQPDMISDARRIWPESD